MSECPPAVSIVIPTRNRAALLPETVRSITEQTGIEWELIIVNDNSTDGTAAYLESLHDPRICGVPNGGRQGQSGACNYGLDQARGEFVMFMDDDDLLRPKGLAKLVTALRQHDSAVAVVGARYDWFCDARGGGRRDSHPFFRRERDMFADLLFGWSAVSAQNIYRTEIARRVGGFNPEIYNVQDRDFWLRVAREGPVVLLPDVVMNYRVHAGQSKPPNVQQLRERVMRMAIRRLPRERRRRALRIQASSRLIQAGESALTDGRWTHATGLVVRASRVWPGMWTSPVLGPWVARRLARRVWHRLCGH
jgi:glycosyltransferase involved in cell wall biosynthesis